MNGIRKDLGDPAGKRKCHDRNLGGETGIRVEVRADLFLSCTYLSTRFETSLNLSRIPLRVDDIPVT